MEQTKHERKKRYGWLVLFSVVNWILVGLMAVFVNPSLIKDVIFPNSYLPMMVIVTGGLFWVYTIILMSAKRAIRWTLGTVIFIYLRINGLGSLLNGFLIFGLLVSSELYLIRMKPTNKEVVA